MQTKAFIHLSIIAVILFVNGMSVGQNDLNGKWRMIGYSFTDQPAFPVERMQIDLTISDNGSIGGKAGCNTFAGIAAFEKGDKLTISRMRSTEMACSEIVMKFEQLFLQTLETATQYSVAEGVLTLTDSKTKNFLRFKQPDTSALVATPIATHEIFYVSNTSVKCTGIAPMKCLQIKKEKSGAWQNYYDTIIGFNYKPGKFYKIEVERTELDNPSSDTAIYRYKLVRIIKCIKKEKDLYL